MLGPLAAPQAIHGRGGITLPAPPEAAKIPVTDDYFGTKAVDDYRWLEDATSPETKAFIDRENVYTARHMEQARIRQQVAGDLDALEHVSSWKAPMQRGNDLFFEKLLAGEEQASIYVRHGWAEKDKRLIDPAQFSRDPNTSVHLADASRDGSLAAYRIREGGADETTVRVLNVKTGKTLPDELPRAICDSVNFTPDGTGLFYTRATDRGSLLYAHALGTRNSQDKLLFGNEFRGEVLGPRYGGFNLARLPKWNPAWGWWMEQGGWFAAPNLRGGGEYGEHWHEQGMLDKKQNVFDDWFAAADYLIVNKYTSPEHFAIRGRSNGGLLMGASIAQRPELFSAVRCGYPLLDMLRYQKFERGAYWTTEYGSAEDAKQFSYLFKYSPYPNLKPGTKYPAVLLWTGSSDTRVDPLHARKMTALLQADSKSGRPVLLHYSLAGGHSSGVSMEQKIQDDTDELTFLWTETGQLPAHK